MSWSLHRHQSSPPCRALPSSFRHCSVFYHCRLFPYASELFLPLYCFFFFNDTATTEIYPLSLHDALPIYCVQCPALMDPIGFALENFEGIGVWRTDEEGTPVDASAKTFDGTTIDGPASLRAWLLEYSDQFVEVVAEKLLTYALGRGVEYQDMPLVRAIAHDAKRSGNRFSTLVLGVVNSKPFQMNMNVPERAVPSHTVAADKSRGAGVR